MFCTIFNFQTRSRACLKNHFRNLHAPLPFQTEKDASHLSMAHSFLCITYFSILLFPIPISVKYLLQYLHLQSD